MFSLQLTIQISTQAGAEPVATAVGVMPNALSVLQWGQTIQINYYFLISASFMFLPTRGQHGSRHTSMHPIKTRWVQQHLFLKITAATVWKIQRAGTCCGQMPIIFSPHFLTSTELKVIMQASHGKWQEQPL